VLNSVVLFVALISFVVVSAKALRQVVAIFINSISPAGQYENNSPVHPFAVIVYLFLLGVFLFYNPVSNTNTWHGRSQTFCFYI
jgi:hypothetical protein